MHRRGLTRRRYLLVRLAVLRHQVTGHRAQIDEIALGHVLNILNLHRLDAIRPFLNVLDRLTGRQRRAIDAGHARLAVTGKDNALQKAVAGFLQFICCNAVLDDAGNLRIHAGFHLLQEAEPRGAP